MRTKRTKQRIGAAGTRHRRAGSRRPTGRENRSRRKADVCMNDGWSRVSVRVPCVVCHKGDWCTVSTKTDAACCMRVRSERPMANGGWLHGGTGPPEPPARHGRPSPSPYLPPEFNARLWWETVRHVSTWERLEVWGKRLGLPVDALGCMGACVLGEMLAFPMYDGHGEVCGIRTRRPDGTKRAITGSRAGVFLPGFSSGPVVICEGPTDATAALALGFNAIGRPSCSGCERHVVDTCRRIGAERVTLCVDADGPGIAGARRLADVLRASRILVRLVTPYGHKDLREWFKTGLTRGMVDAVWSQAEWT